MIGRLRGLLLEKHPPEILLDVNGVGYEVSMPMSCFYELPELNKEAVVFTHFVVREDAQLLYGFNTPTERALFREIIKANGVGPKLGLAILSSMTALQFVDSVAREDVTSLVKIPGVGKKTAERLLIDMRDRLKNWTAVDLFTPQSDIAARESLDVAFSTISATSATEEALSALLSLGYKTSQAEKMIRQVAKDDMKSEDIIRDALRSMV